MSRDSETAAYVEETTNKFADNKQQWNLMYAKIMNKLDLISKSVITSPNEQQNKAVEKEEFGAGKSWLPTIEETPRHTFTTTPYTTTAQWGHPSETVPYHMEPEIKHTTAIPSVFPLNGVKHSVIVPPSSAAPAFYGKHSESPTQFLIRVQEYAETVLEWNRSTLLLGITQFLRDTALDWYCQLKVSGHKPQTWTEFVELFLSQFTSPIRSARQEQEWYECKQGEDETINEFIIRLRVLWTKQKPKETEVDLIKHLFCKMRNDSLLSMMGVPCGATLDEIIREAQEVEEILYRRKKEERLLKYLNQTSTQNGTLNVNKSQCEVTNKHPKPLLTMNVKYPSNNKTAPHQRITFNKKNTDRSYPTTNYYKQTTAKIDSEERRKRLKQSLIQRPTEVQREIEKPIQLSIVEQEDSTDEQLKSTIDLDEERSLYSFWPDGIESWHTHEIKPQREAFTRNIFPDPMVMVQNATIEAQPETLEKFSNFQTVCHFDEVNYLQSQRMMEPSVGQFKPSKKIFQNTAKSLQILSLVSAMKNQQQRNAPTPEMPYLQRKLKSRHKRNETSRKPVRDDLLTVSNSSMQLPLYHRPRNRLLPLLPTCLIQLSLFLFSVLLRIGIAHNLGNSSDIFYDEPPALNLRVISTSSTIYLREFLNKFIPYAKTIKILRDLESLLIYALI